MKGARSLLLARTHTEHTGERTLHAVHLLLASLLFFSGHLGQPLLAVLADLTVDHLVVLLAALTDLIPEHLALGETLRGRLLAIHGTAGLQAESRGKAAHANGGLLLLLFGELLLEALTHGLLTLGELHGDASTLERLEDRANILHTHTSKVLQEGDESNKGLVFGITGPLVQNNSVLRLQTGVLLLSINQNDLGQVTVQVRQILIGDTGQTKAIETIMLEKIIP